MNSFVKKIVTVAATAALTLSSAAALAAAPLQLGVPDDGTNLSRGIKLLEAAGFIKVDPAAATRRKSRISPTTSTTSR